MKKAIAILVVISLIITGVWMLPVIGEHENDVSSTSDVRGESRSSTLYVGPGQTYTKIQDAINASNSGDTIRVYAGTYYENIVMDKTLTLIGNGSGDTIINGSYSGSVITVKADWCNISGFYVTASGSSPWDDAGIKLQSVENCNITYSNCSLNYMGIMLFNSNYSNIQYCTGKSNSMNFINLTYSNNNFISYCSGFWNHVGIDLSNSDWNIFENNSCYGNSWGIRLHYSNRNRITYNTIKQSYYFGIHNAELGHYNSFYFNNFINNNQGGKQAREDNGFNTWNHTQIKKGNYWSDWTSPDNDADGIVDNPYYIPGIGSNYDYHPLVQPTIFVGSSPVITTASITKAYVGEYYAVNYSVYDPDTSSYELTWKMETNASWLNFGTILELNGTPTSSDIGTYWVNVSASDETNTDFVNFTLTVSKRTKSSGTVIIERTGQQFSKIQDAIDNATAYDTIKIWAGTYIENIVLDKNLTLIGNGSANTIIDAEHWSDTIIINVNGCNIVGITVTGGEMDPYVDCICGSNGIVINSKYNNIEDCVITNHHQGIYINGSYNYIRRCKINSSWFDGIFLMNSDKNLISNCTITDNGNAGPSSGINSLNSNHNTIISSTIEGNKENGILIDGSKNVINNCQISINSNNGIYINTNSKDNSISYNTIYRNQALGVSVRSNSKNNYIHHNNFINNSWAIYNAGIQGEDWGSDNRWNTSTEGNYWSDFVKRYPNATNNGTVWNRPYEITSFQNSSDHHPLVKPVGEFTPPPSYPPTITSQNVMTTYVNQLYYVKYTAIDSDTPQNQLTWGMHSNASWLTFNQKGELSGTPKSSDVGKYWVNISVSDEVYTDWTNFTLTVMEKQKPKLPEPSNGTVIIERTGQKYPKINYAIANATKGDTIRVWSGTYYENVYIDKKINLIGNGSADTIIDAAYHPAVITVKADGCKIKGFTLTGGEANELVDCICGSSGVEISGNENQVEDCEIYKVYDGIYLDNNAHENQIINCSIHNNRLNGILLDAAEGNTILDCHISRNGETGIYFKYANANSVGYCNISFNNFKGIQYWVADSNFVRNCTIFFNNNYGIDIGANSNNLDDNSENNTIINSTIKSHKTLGIRISFYCKNNVIHHNNFINNSWGINNSGVQADDWGTQNTWNTSSEGNYWSDYEKRYPKATNDGRVWNIPYNITGIPGAKDYYPLVKRIDEGKYEPEPPKPKPKPEPAKVVSSSFGNNSYNISVNSSEIIITFSKPMNCSIISSVLKITPHVNYTLVWEKNNTVLRIILNENLSYNTTYRISIDPSSEYDSDILDSPYELVFKTQEEQQEGELPGEDKPTNGIKFFSNPVFLGLIIGLIILTLIIITFAVLMKSKKRKKDKTAVRFDGRQEITGGKIAEEFEPPKGVANGTEEFILELREEVLVSKKPSDFQLSQEKMLDKFRKKYKKGEISRETFNLIEESLSESKR